MLIRSGPTDVAGAAALYLAANAGATPDAITSGLQGSAVDAITTGLGWSKAAEYITVSGKPEKSDLERCWELGATVAAQLMA